MRTGCFNDWEGFRWIALQSLTSECYYAAHSMHIWCFHRERDLSSTCGTSSLHSRERRDGTAQSVYLIEGACLAVIVKAGGTTF
jgi:hypothetical protein